MKGNIYFEIFGYIGTALVITSMMMTSVMKLRLINICGGIISAVYSAFYGAWAVVIMNACLIIINVFQIIRQLRHKYKFGHIIVDTNDGSVLYFLSLYRDDIEKFYPDFRSLLRADAEVHMVFNGGEAIAILAGERTEDIFRIEMYYEIPKYRGAVVEKFLFPMFKDSGINKVTAAPVKPQSSRMIKMGFADNCGIMLKNL